MTKFYNLEPDERLIEIATWTRDLGPWRFIDGAATWTISPGPHEKDAWVVVKPPTTERVPAIEAIGRIAADENNDDRRINGIRQARHKLYHALVAVNAKDESVMHVAPDGTVEVLREDQ